MTLTLYFQGQILKYTCSVLGMGGLIDMEQKGCELLACLTLNFDVAYDLDLEFYVYASKTRITLVCGQHFFPFMCYMGRG